MGVQNKSDKKVSKFPWPINKKCPNFLLVGPKKKFFGIFGTALNGATIVPLGPKPGDYFCNFIRAQNHVTLLLKKQKQKKHRRCCASRRRKPDFGQEKLKRMCNTGVT